MFVIAPKLTLPTTLPGWPKFAWLKRSKNSARNSIPAFADAVFLISEKSTV